MFKAAIFDMDGVMVDTEHIQSRAFEEILQEYGITPVKNEHGIVHVPGATSVQIWEALKKQYKFDADAELLTKKKRAAVISVIQKGLDPLPALLDLLLDLQNHNINLAIATAAQRDRVNLITEKIGAGKHFTVTVTANDVTATKPAPDVYIKAAKMLAVAPGECVVFEDTDVGVQAARAAGMKVIAVPNEYTKRMDSSQADMTIDSLVHIDYDTLCDLFKQS